MSLVPLPVYTRNRVFVEYQTRVGGEMTLGVYYDSLGCTYITRDTLESLLGALKYERISQKTELNSDAL